jgi:hydroxysqualene synthase
MKVDTTLNSQDHRYTLDEAFAVCADVTKAHYENFPVASLFLPQEKRPYIQAIYAFSRTADDFADEASIAIEERLQKLDSWEEQLQQAYEGNATHPIFIALRETVKRLDIPIEPLRDLLTAFRRDVIQNRYETYDDLLSYCRCSANPVGRLVLMVFGYRDDKLLEHSDAICTALQLTNFWQDVFIDQQKNRLYIPLEDMRQFGYSEDDWQNRRMNDALRRLLRFEATRTRKLFYQGATLPSMVERDLQLELKLVWFGGLAVLRKLEKVKFDVRSCRPTLSTSDKLMILLRGLFRNDLTIFRKKRVKKEPWDLT